MMRGFGARLRLALSYIWWPLLLGLCLLGVERSIAAGIPFIGFNAIYLSLALALLVLERVMPHEPLWQRADGQTLADLAHTVFNKGAVQGVIYAGTAIGLSQSLGPEAGPYWPSHWPMLAQIVFGLVLVEFGFYWVHRIAHESPLVWRVHAVHHSAPRLWVVNTGRFHFLETFLNAAAAFVIVAACGMPQTLVVWGAAFHAFIGLLTHCNVEMRFFGLSLIFNTPELHRWHHSMVLAEGNRNYGQNLPIWDLVFGTYYNPARRPPAVIGIPEKMPSSFLGQLQAPFLWRRLQASTAEGGPWVEKLPVV